MAGAPFNGKSLGLVSFLGFRLVGFRLSGLSLLSLGLLRVSLLCLLSLGLLRLGLGRNLFRLRCRLRSSLGSGFRRAYPTRTIGFRRDRLLLHQLDHRHRGVIAFACLDFDDAGIAAVAVGEER